MKDYIYWVLYSYMYVCNMGIPLTTAQRYKVTPLDDRGTIKTMQEPV